MAWPDVNSMDAATRELVSRLEANDFNEIQVKGDEFDIDIMPMFPHDNEPTLKNVGYFSVNSPVAPLFPGSVSASRVARFVMENSSEFQKVVAEREAAEKESGVKEVVAKEAAEEVVEKDAAPVDPKTVIIEKELLSRFEANDFREIYLDGDGFKVEIEPLIRMEDESKLENVERFLVNTPGMPVEDYTNRFFGSENLTDVAAFVASHLDSIPEMRDLVAEKEAKAKALESKTNIIEKELLSRLEKNNFEAIQTLGDGFEIGIEPLIPMEKESTLENVDFFVVSSPYASLFPGSTSLRDVAQFVAVNSPDLPAPMMSGVKKEDVRPLKSNPNVMAVRTELPPELAEHSKDTKGYLYVPAADVHMDNKSGYGSVKLPINKGGELNMSFYNMDGKRVTEAVSTYDVSNAHAEARREQNKAKSAEREAAEVTPADELSTKLTGVHTSQVRPLKGNPNVVAVRTELPNNQAIHSSDGKGYLYVPAKDVHMNSKSGYGTVELSPNAKDEINMSFYNDDKKRVTESVNVYDVVEAHAEARKEHQKNQRGASELVSMLEASEAEQEAVDKSIMDDYMMCYD